MARGRGEHHQYGSDEALGTATAPTQETPKTNKKVSLLVLPDGGGGNISEEKFWPWVESLNAVDDWSHGFGYLYRDWPVTDAFLPYPDPKAAKQAGAVKYIERFSENFSRETVLHRHGSGKYHIDFNDTNIKGSTQTVCRCFFTLNDERFPPNPDLNALLVGHPDNKAYVMQLRREGKLPPEGASMQPAAGSDAQTAALLVPVIRELLNRLDSKKPDNIDGQLVPKIMDMFSKASDKSIEMALRQVKPEATANDQLVMFDKIIGLVEKMKGEKPAEDSSMKMLMQQMLEDRRAHQEELREERKANRELMNKLLERKNSGGDEDEPKGMMKTVMESLLQRALDGLDGGGGRHLTFWQEQTPMLVEQGIKALEHLTNLAGMFITRGQAPRATFPGAPPASPNPAPAGGLPAPEPAPGGEAPVNPMVQILNEITAPLIEHLKSPDLSGRDFAEWFIYGMEGTGTGGYGPRAFKQVQVIGKETLLNACKNYAPIASQLADVSDERITTFLEDFFLGPPDGDDDEPPEGESPINRRDGPVEVIPAKPRRKKPE